MKNSYSVHCPQCGARLAVRWGAGLQTCPPQMTPDEIRHIADVAARHLAESGHDVREMGVEIIAHWRVTFASLTPALAPVGSEGCPCAR